MRAILLVLILLSVPLVRAQPEPGTSMPAEVGTGQIAWFDLCSTNLTLSKEFYGKLFDWRFNPLPGTEMAVEILASGRAVGTLRLAEGALSPYNGVVYVQVPDMPASCGLAQELGGSLVPGFPFNLPNGTGAVGLLLDPVGHPVGLYSRTPLAVQPTTP